MTFSTRFDHSNPFIEAVTTEIEIRTPPLSSILAKILAKVPIVWNFRSNLSSWSYCFRKYLQKISACGAKFPLIFFVWDAILPCIRVQNHAKQDQNFSPAAQNGPLFRIQVTIFWNFQPKGSYCLKFSSKCLKRWYYRGGGSYFYLSGTPSRQNL